jgi:hypothetical protein
MTYIKSGLPQKLDANFNIYYNASVGSIANDEPITYADEDTSFGKSFSLSRSGSNFTLPVNGSIYYLEAAICYWYVFDGTVNYDYAAYVGVTSLICNGMNITEGRSGDIVADETAKYATSGGVYQLRLKTTTGHLTAVDRPNQYFATDPYASARCLIWRL